MPGSNTVDGDLRVTGQLTPGTFNAPAACIANANVREDATDPIGASKIEVQGSIDYRQKAGADVATAVEDVSIVRGTTGSLASVDVACSTAPTGGDKAFTVDVQKGNQSTGFATLLTAPVAMNNTRANRQVVAGSLVGSPTLADGDTLRVVVTTSGTTGSQGQGLCVTLTTRQKPNP